VGDVAVVGHGVVLDGGHHRHGGRAHLVQGTVVWPTMDLVRVDHGGSMVGSVVDHRSGMVDHGGNMVDTVVGGVGSMVHHWGRVVDTVVDHRCVVHHRRHMDEGLGRRRLRGLGQIHHHLGLLSGDFRNNFSNFLSNFFNRLLYNRFLNRFFNNSLSDRFLHDSGRGLLDVVVDHGGELLPEDSGVVVGGVDAVGNHWDHRDYRGNMVGNVVRGGVVDSMADDRGGTMYSMDGVGVVGMDGVGHGGLAAVDGV